MYKIVLAQVFLLFVCVNAFAQNVVDFELSQPVTKVDSSLYNTITFIDSRDDTTNVGVVQTGFFNRMGLVKAKTPLATQVSSVFNSLITAHAKQGETLLQLRQFSFAELITGLSERGYCYMQARLYAKNGERYKKISSIDTIITLSSSIDVSNSILKAGKEGISNFIRNGIILKPTDSVSYSYHDILKIDSIEKRKIKLYNADTYKDGLYATFQSFMNQVPDKPISSEGHVLFPGFVKTTDEDGKLKDVKSKDFYAAVYQGQPYICSKTGYYPLEKVKDDFYFIGDAKSSANTGTMVAASALFGVVGGIIASAPTTSFFYMKIDHKNGKFIRLK